MHKIDEIDEHLLKVFYERYLAEGVVRQYGLYPWDLTDYSGIRFNDAGDALAAVERLIEKGWVRSDKYSRRLAPSHSIQLTEKGINHAEELLTPKIGKYFRDFYKDTIEAITRGIKK